MTDPVWLPLTEAAVRLGLSTNALKMRVKRGTVLASRDNRGKVMVSVGSVATPTDPLGRDPEKPTPPTLESTRPTPLENELVTELRAQIERLRDDLSRERAAHSSAMEAALDRAERQHKAEIDRLAQAHKSAVTALMDRVGRMLIAQRPAPRAPWWSVLFGASRRSKIGGE
ncbi:MAG: hypothetical protein WCF85_11575 [Rhodospirillaceae bacterium]